MYINFNKDFSTIHIYKNAIALSLRNKENKQNITAHYYKVIIPDNLYNFFINFAENQKAIGKRGDDTYNYILNYFSPFFNVKK